MGKRPCRARARRVPTRHASRFRATGPGLVAAALIALPAGSREGPERAVPVQEARPAGLPIDRWLASEALPEATAAIEADTSFFPDRARTMAGSRWELLRRDSVASFELDSLRGQPSRGEVVYAHAYVRSPDDRTVKLEVSGPACGGTAAWLNGQPLERAPGDGDDFPHAGRPAPPGASAADPAGAGASAADRAPGLARPVRLGAGWNTLLVRIQAGDCPTRLAARLEPFDPGEAGSGEAREGGAGVEGLRVQASRPPGVRRDWPAPFVSVSGTRVDRIVWPADGELRAGVGLGLTSWGAADGRPRAEGARADTAAARPGPPEGRRRPPEGAAGRRGPPPADDPRVRRARLRDRLRPPPPPALPAPEAVEIDAEADGGRAAGTFPLPGPARTTRVELAFPFEDVRDAALSGGGLQLRTRWMAGEERREREARRPIAAASVLEAVHGPIELTGWRESETGRSGEWTVPEALAGFSLELVDPPAGARVGGGTAERGPGGGLLLCSACRRGQRLSLELPAAGAGERTPSVRVVEPGYPSAASREGAPPAARWLAALGKDGNRDYLELAREHGGSDGPP